MRCVQQWKSYWNECPNRKGLFENGFGHHQGKFSVVSFTTSICILFNQARFFSKKYAVYICPNYRNVHKILPPDGLFLSLMSNQVYSFSFPVPRAVTINATRSPLCLAHVSQPPKINLATLNHTPTLTALCSPVACTSTLLPFRHDSSACSFFSPVSLRSTSILKAGRHDPGGKPCCQEQRRYVTICCRQCEILFLSGFDVNLLQGRTVEN